MGTSDSGRELERRNVGTSGFPRITPASRGPRAQMLREGCRLRPDSGFYDAVDAGLTLARGEVIGLLNADDFLTGMNTCFPMLCGAFSNVGTRWRLRRFALCEASPGDARPATAQGPGAPVRARPGGFSERLDAAASYAFPSKRDYTTKAGKLQNGFWLGGRLYQVVYGGIDTFLGRPLGSPMLPDILVCMEVGGISNRSLNHRRKTQTEWIARHGGRTGSPRDLSNCC